MRLALLGIMALGLSAFPIDAAAQFHFPLPPAIPADSVCAAKHFEQGDDHDCRKTWTSAPEFEQDTEGVRDDKSFNRKVIPWQFPGTDSDIGVRKLYGSTGIRSFNDFSAAIREDRVYVSTSLLSGVVGRTYFDFSIAKVVAKAGDDEQDPEVFEDGVSSAYRVINNGGSAALRFLLPVYSGGGTVSQRTFGFFLQGGGIGPLDQPEDLHVTSGVGFEALTSMAIRKTDYTHVGSLLLGGRIAAQHVFEDRAIIDETDDRTMKFFQIVVGLQQGNTTRLSLVYTNVESEYKDLVPAVQFTVQTIPGG